MRDTTQLHPVLQAKIIQLKALCKKEGINIVITDCVRTKAEQDALYAKGRTAPGTIVTNVKYPNSMHNFCVAADFGLDMDIDGDGKKTDDTYNNNKKTFDRVGEIAESIGLRWGGNFRTIVDKPHLQLATWGDTPKKLIEKYGTPEKFMATWVKFEPREYTTTKEMWLYKTDKVSDSNRLPWDQCNIKDKCTNVGGFAKLNKGVKITVTDIAYKDTGRVLGKLKKAPMPWCCLYNDGYQVK